MSIKFIVTKDYDEMSLVSADIIADIVKEKPDCVLGLATGSTPIGLYKQLVLRYQAGELDFAKVKSANLDEYLGLAPEHDQSYRYFMNDNLFDHINIDKANTHVPNGLAADVDGECARYDALIESLGGVDIQLLGIGHDGHIGFNEPADHFTKGTNCTHLTDMTISANARFFASKNEVPTKALTMGCGTIMKAHKVLMVISGEGKAEILKQAFFGPVTPDIPASILQFHNDVTVVCDEAAWSLVK